jgi:precorrin-2/cobalt-factor-2 C20-methyltransferase
MHKSSIYLPERLKSALAVRASATGVAEAQIVRDAIEAHLARDASAPVPAADLAVRGRLVGVGVGPGDPHLLTLQAVGALRRADRVVAPATAVDAVGRAEAIVRQALPGLRVERVAFEMAPTRAARDRSVEEAARVVASHLAAGEEVAWITLGDPLTYSTFSSLAAAVRRRRPATTVAYVPGIMAFQSLAALTGTVVADERQRITIRTALDGEDLTADLADRDATVVVYKGGRRLPELARAAAAAGRAEQAVAGELLGMPGERVSSLARLGEAGPASYLATVILPAPSASKAKRGRTAVERVPGRAAVDMAQTSERQRS